MIEVLGGKIPHGNVNTEADFDRRLSDLIELNNDAEA
jgi:hypothetical protein